MDSPHIFYFSDLIGESKIAPNIGIRLPSEGYNIVAVLYLNYQRNTLAENMFTIPFLSLKILNVIFKCTALSLKDYALSFIQVWKD